MYAIGRLSKRITSDKQGFTLIEMAVVLIIIGLIIGAVVKGKDLVVSAKQKKLYAKFLQSWQLSYNSYYDRCGWILGDWANNTNSIRDGHCGNAPAGPWASCGNLTAQLTAVGLETPPEGATGSSCARLYRDAAGTDYTLTLAFKYLSGIGNYIEISSDSGMPPELGIAWDNIIDGQMDGEGGDFLYSPDGSASMAAWPAADAVPVPASVGILRLQF